MLVFVPSEISYEAARIFYRLQGRLMITHAGNLTFNNESFKKFSIQVGTAVLSSHKLSNLKEKLIMLKWFKRGQGAGGPDFSAVDSQEKARNCTVKACFTSCY